VRYRAGMPIVIVTDSSAYLPTEVAAGITVVPLIVALGGVDGDEGAEVGPAEVAAALAERRVAVTTSRPPPERFVRTYRRLLDSGAQAVVSIHLSAKLSGTYEAAVLAAQQVGPDRIAVVDARSAGMGLGFCALAAAEVAAHGGGLAEVREAAQAAVARTTTFFYVDTLEFLRRGGRISAASALVGTALSVKPILHVADGVIVARDKVRTASRALDRLVELAVEAADGSRVDIAIHHLVAAERARGLGESLSARLGDRLRRLWTSEVGAAVGAHCGPGLAGVVVHRLDGDTVAGTAQG
jgi:DegV family protein with EDD domain